MLLACYLCDPHSFYSFCQLLLKPVLFLSLFIFSLYPFSLLGQLYSLLNHYYIVVCKNCRKSRPKVNLYHFIYEEASTPTPTNVLDPGRDSEMSPATSDSH